MRPVVGGCRVPHRNQVCRSLSSGSDDIQCDPSVIFHTVPYILLAYLGALWAQCVHPLPPYRPPGFWRRLRAQCLPPLLPPGFGSRFTCTVANKALWSLSLLQACLRQYQHGAVVVGSCFRWPSVVVADGTHVSLCDPIPKPCAPPKLCGHVSAVSGASNGALTNIALAHGEI